ncbi:MAG: glycosyltransferase [Chitinophagaceae bacterium]|nr:glycosyltransferase [Chitinophagaceae bacterium]
MIYQVLHILFLALFIYLSVNVGYLLLISITGLFARRKSSIENINRKKIAVLITSYKEDDVIVNTIRQAVEHDYPKENFDVFLVADQLQPSTIEKIKTFDVHVSEVNFPVGSKARSLNFLLNKIDPAKYDIALVLDGDNIMTPGFLEKINSAFQEGFKAVQAHRTAKNRNTPVAVLDALSEEINNHLFRRAQRALGFSSSLIGSGMAFEFDTLKKVYNKPGILDNPACDREVDFEMMKNGITVQYLDDAMLLDEKVSSGNVFEKQRRRWLESQMLHLKLFLSKNEHVTRKTKDYWNKLFINLIPPRIIFLAIFFIIFLCCLAQYFLEIDITGFAITWWIVLFAAYILSLIIAVPSHLITLSTLKAFLYLPSVLFSYIKAAFTMKINRKEFVHTPKTYTGKTESTEK